MNWKAEFSPRAARELRKLDKPIRTRILEYVRETAALEDPRIRGKALTGNWSGYWRWRVGDYRLIVSIEDDQLLVLVVSAGHCSSVY